MKRKEEIKKAVYDFIEKNHSDLIDDDFALGLGFQEGANWADNNPPGNDLLRSPEDDLKKAKEALSEILEFHFYGHHAEKFKKILKELNDT